MPIAMATSVSLSVCKSVCLHRPGIISKTKPFGSMITSSHQLEAVYKLAICANRDDLR